MNLITKLNDALNKLVGPNAAHMIDALIGLALVSGGALVYSAPARVFLLHHALLGALVTLGAPALTALASKFRKAAGSNASLVDEITAAVSRAVADTQYAAAVTTYTDARPEVPAK